jgi:hypothetical protein
MQMARLSAEIIGAQLQKFRGDRSLREAARDLGFSHTMIRLCETGKKLPSLELLIAAMDKWNATFLLNGYQVVPKEYVGARGAKPQPIQGALPRLRPRSYKTKTVNIRERDNELVITAVARITTARR